MYAGKSLSEIARLDDYQLRWVVFRRRDKYGGLMRRGANDLPPHVQVDANGMRVVTNPQPFSKMFRDVKRRQGVVNERDIEERWKQYTAENPQLVNRKRSSRRK